MKRISLPILVFLSFLVSCERKDAPVKEDTPASAAGEVASRICASDELLQQQIESDPQRAAFMQRLEEKTAAFEGRKARYNGVLYIPVVVHIVLPDPNLVTDAQVKSQIDILNQDFNRQNKEIVNNTSVYLAGYDYNKVANCQLQFYLGAPVIRKVGGTATFGTNDAVKKTSQGGSDPLNPTTMMNMWVCDLSSGLLGYAQFPGGSAATDGVVIDYQGFGNTSSGYALYSAFNLGRTATHEVGHWLNLRHIWGDARCGTDYVTDTPAHDTDNGGCPAQGHQSRCAGKPLEQWMNYMDYTYDACMYMFSSGQKVRMDAAIDAARAAYVSSTAPTTVY